ncbi:MAG: hypothetical protein LVR00_06595 [Rhabdochlamydiaceae bacterium]|jgi:hypothetical protein
MYPLAAYPVLDALPERRSLRVSEKDAQKAVTRFFREADEKEFRWPKTADVPLAARHRISQELDASALRVYKEYVDKIQGKEEHKKNCKALAEASKNCGGFSSSNTILRDATPLEQMVALDHWIQQKGSGWQKGRRTLCLGAKDDYVPVYIAKRAGVHPTSMSVMLGCAVGGHKAPKYSQLAEDEDLAKTSVFKDPLDALEIVRQPYFAAATLLKAGAFACEEINARRRYEITDQNNENRRSQFACVELIKQNDPQNAPTKEHSAGTNLYSLVHKASEECQINKNVLFEEFAPEGYNDDAEVGVTPVMLWDATKESLLKNDRAELDSLMERLFIAHVGKITSPSVADFYAQRIFPRKADT